MARAVWILGVFAIAAVILIAGGADFLLDWEDNQTITSWLRENPLWYYVPVAVLLLFLAWLWFHLFWIFDHT